jgi:hypothetical protein
LASSTTDEAELQKKYFYDEEQHEYIWQSNKKQNGSTTGLQAKLEVMSSRGFRGIFTCPADLKVRKTGMFQVQNKILELFLQKTPDGTSEYTFEA